MYSALTVIFVPIGVVVAWHEATPADSGAEHNTSDPALMLTVPDGGTDGALTVARYVMAVPNVAGLGVAVRAVVLD
jgi:hypothetical protein